MQQFGDKIWEELFATQGWGKYPPEEVIRFFVRAKKDLNKPVIKALDIGCGMGACTWFMNKEGAKVTAFDGAPTGINNVSKLAEEFGVFTNFTLLLGDITKPHNHIDSRFDIMLDNYSLCANPEKDIHSALKDYYEILYDGGYLLMNCFGEKTTGFGIGKQLSEHTWTDMSRGGVLYNRGIVTWFTRQRLNTIFQTIGYNINYYENILEDRCEIIIEKHIFCLTKQA